MVQAMFLKQMRQRLSLTQKFMVISLIILLIGMVIIGGWVANRIEQVVVEHGATVTTLYMNTFIPPLLEDLTEGQNIDEIHQHMLRHLLTQTALTDNIISLNVWTPDRTLVYSSLPFAQNASGSSTLLDTTVNGDVTSRITTTSIHQPGEALIQTFVPVFDAESGAVIAVVESYQDARSLLQQVQHAQNQSWLVVFIATGLMYLLLFGLVRGANYTINQQQRQLQASVNDLQTLLDENTSLHEKVQTAAIRANEVNEQFLHRLGHELHDGPAQDIALALLRIGDVCSQDDAQLKTIQHALDSALKEIRTIAAGLQLPELHHLKLVDVGQRALREFKRKTGAEVTFRVAEEFPDIPLAKKQIIYRAMTEMLNNAYKHANATGLTGHLDIRNGSIHLEVSDTGQGFDPDALSQDHDRLGLIGLQQRITFIGGTIDIQSEPHHGTQITVKLPVGEEVE